MTFTGRGKQLTIFISETDQFHHQALYMAIIEMLRRAGCSGATAVRGVAGFGASSMIHRASILRLSMDLPLVIIVVDRPERIDRIIGPLREMAPSALITVQEVEVAQSGAPFKEGLPDVKVSEVMHREVATLHPDSPITAVSLKRATDLDYVRGLHDSLENPHHKVSEVMTRQVVTITPDAILARAARLMVEKHLKRLPVVDSDGKLVGILGRLDILNTIAAVHLPQWHPEAHPVGEQATVAEVMTREVPTVHDSAIVEEIFELLVSSSHKRVVVVDDKRQVVGIIADSDLISRVSRESWPGIMEVLISKVPIGTVSSEARRHIQKLRARSAKEFMTREVITVRDKMPVASALALSAEKRVKRLPVVNAEGELVGIVGRTEMMRALLA